MFKLLPLLCTHVYSYMFSKVHPPSPDDASHYLQTHVIDFWLKSTHFKFATHKQNVLTRHPCAISTLYIVNLVMCYTE